MVIKIFKSVQLLNFRQPFCFDFVVEYFGIFPGHFGNFRVLSRKHELTARWTNNLMDDQRRVILYASMHRVPRAGSGS